MSAQLQNIPIIQIEKSEKKEDERFIYWNFEGRLLPAWGWKLHVSANIRNYQQIREIVEAFCSNNKINFKVLKNRDILLKSLAKNASRIFAGKYITIYPENRKQAQQYVKDLYKLLRHFKGPEILTDRSYKHSIVHYRFGSFWAEKMLSTHKIDQSWIDADRKINVYKPENVKDLFQGKPSYLTREVGKYRVITPIQYTNFGGVYFAEKDGEKFLLKEVRRYFEGASDPVTLSKNSIRISKKIRSEYLREFVESFWHKRYFFTVYKWENHPTLEKIKTNLTPISPWNSHEPGKHTNKFKKLIKLFIKLLKSLHKKDLILNDIKANNFVWNGEDELRFIDVDASFMKDEKPHLIYDFYGKKDEYPTQLGDIRKVGYLLADLLSNCLALCNEYTNHSFIVGYFEDFCYEMKIDHQLFATISFLMNFSEKDKLEDISKLKSVSPNLNKNIKKYSIISKEKLRELDLMDIITAKLWPNKPENDDSWYLAYKNISEGSETESREQLNLIIKETVKDINGYKLVKIIGKNYYSPYLDKGAALLALLILKYKEKFKLTTFDEMLDSLLASNSCRFILKSGFMFGISGLIYLLFECYKTLGKEEFLEEACEYRKTLDLMYVEKENNFFTYNKELLSEDELKLVKKILEFFGVRDSKSNNSC